MENIISNACRQEGICFFLLLHDSEENIRLSAIALKAKCLTRHAVLLPEDSCNTQSAFEEIIAFINCNYTGRKRKQERTITQSLPAIKIRNNQHHFTKL